MTEPERLGRDLDKTIEGLYARALVQMEDTKDPMAAGLPGGFKTALDARLGIVDELIRRMLADEKVPPRDRPPIAFADITQCLTEGGVQPQTTNALVRLMMRRARRAAGNVIKLK